MDVQVIQLNYQVLGLTDMLRRTLGKQIVLSTVLERNAWTIRADPSQLQSAIVNMVTNARDAMPAGGRLVMEIRNVVLDPDHSYFDPHFQPGEYIQLSISDTGSGMPPHLRGRAVEPSFSGGAGLGLGLAMVYRFVKQSGGHITVFSELGHGTTFNLYFPRAYDDTT